VFSAGGACAGGWALALPVPLLSQRALIHTSTHNNSLSVVNLCFCCTRRQQLTYQFSAIAATTGVSGAAVLAVYYKFVFAAALSGSDGSVPWLDMAGTLALVVGGVAGMEMWARWAHRALWHDFAPGWGLHKSHHEPRTGPFEVGGLVWWTAPNPDLPLVAVPLESLPPHPTPHPVTPNTTLKTQNRILNSPALHRPMMCTH
jgi:hypothetical protein